MILDDRITAVVGCCFAIVHPEEKVRDVPYTSQNVFCSLYIGGSSPPGKAGGKSSAGYGRKLSALIDNSGDGVWKLGAFHSVHDHASHGKTSFIDLVSCLHLDYGRQQRKIVL